MKLSRRQLLTSFVALGATAVIPKVATGSKSKVFYSDTKIKIARFKTGDTVYLKKNESLLGTVSYVWNRLSPKTGEFVYNVRLKGPWRIPRVVVYTENELAGPYDKYLQLGPPVYMNITLYENKA